MRPKAHVVTSVIFFLPVYMFTNSIIMSFLFCLTQVLVDIDHVFDYLFFSKKPYSLKKFFQKGNPLTWSNVVFFFHSWEWVAILFGFCLNTKNIFAWAVFGGYFLHMAADEVINRITYKILKIDKFYYFFIFRCINNFNIDRICHDRNAFLESMRNE